MGLKYLLFTHDIGGSVPSTAKEIKSFILFWVSEMGPQSVNPGCTATDYLDPVNFELVVIPVSVSHVLRSYYHKLKLLFEVYN